jgi:hypothetical protein
MRPKIPAESTPRESPEQRAMGDASNAAEHGVVVAKVAMWEKLLRKLPTCFQDSK